MSNEVDMETKAFSKMQRVKILHLDYVTLKRDFKDFPKGLIWLRWQGFPLEYLPTSLYITRLVVLDMHNSSLKQVWKDTECLPNLKILNLNHSHCLLKTPNFSGLPNLEKLMLKDCIKLIELSLESCRLSDDVMPSDLSSLPSLKCLNLSRNPLQSRPESIRSLTKLDQLLLTSCTKLQVIPKLPILSNFVEVSKSISPLMVGLSSLMCLFSSKQCVIFGCERLTEIEDVFKLEPIENFETEEIKSLYKMESIDCNKVQLYNYLTDTKTVVTPQVIHECGITSTFIPGSEVPIWFEHRTKEPQIAFSLLAPSHPGMSLIARDSI
ncbi:hypothetical protein CRYUN_Cryun18bG0043900 [Craigia yunnanensis]